MDKAVADASEPKTFNINISDVRITGLESSLIGANSKCYLILTTNEYSNQTEPARGGTSLRWPDTFNFSVPESCQIEMCVVRVKLFGGESALGRVVITIRAMLRVDGDVIYVGPLSLTALPGTTQPPRCALLFKLVHYQLNGQSTTRYQARPLVNQIQNDVTGIASTSKGGQAVSPDTVLAGLTVAGSLLQTNGSLAKFLSACSTISEIHPAAQLAVTLITSAYQAWQNQETRDEKVITLAQAVAHLWVFMTQDESLERITAVKATVTSMLTQTSECAKFIRGYTAHVNKGCGSFCKNTFGDTDTIITSFEQSFAKLKDDFLAGIDITTVITVLDTQQVVLDMQKTLGRIQADLSRSQILRNTAPQHPPKPVIARAAPVIFHGRQEYVSTIVQTILRSQQPHAAILGAGGMGKTSVALAVVNDRAIIARFRTRRHFVPCEEITRTTLLIEHIANHLGIALSPLNQLQDIITSLRETLSPCIVVLDNFETTWGPHETRSQVEDIIAQLACVPGLVLIVTMRGTLTPLGVSWSQTLPQISRLSPDAARVTFLDICPRQDDMLDTLLQSLDFVPLAITLIAKVGEASQLSPSALLKKWKKEQTKLLNLGPSDRLQSVDHSIALSLQSASMTANPEALQLLSVLAMLPSGALLERLPRLAPRIVHIDAAVWSLLRTSLVYQDETGGPLQLLSPIRSYISQHHAPDIDSLQDLREYYYRIASKCLCKPGDAGFINIKKEVIPEGHNMEAVLSDALTRCGDEDSVIASLQYSRFLYWNSPRTDNLKLALQVIRTAPYPRLLGRCLLELGDMHRLLNQYERARSTLEEAQRHFAQTGKQIEVAHCLWILSDILNMQCRYDEAIAMLADAQQRFQTLNNGLGVAQCLRSLGNALRMKNLYEEARIVLEDARQRCEEADYPVGCAQCMWSIGNVLRKQSRYAEARFMLEEAQRQFRELGNRLGMAQCMRTLGNILRNQRHYDEARPLLEDARRELVDIGDRLGAAQILRNLGDILRMECYHNEARIVLEHAMRQFKGLGYRVGAAQTLRSLGNILRVQRRLQEARLVFNEARQEFQVLGYRSGAAQCLWGLGEILRVEGSYEEAHVVLVDSLTQLRDIGDPTGVAWCLKSIGDTFFDEGRYDEAWPALENAKDWFKDVDPYGITECQETIDKILLARGGDDVDGYLLLDQGEDPPVGAEDRLPG